MKYTLTSEEIDSEILKLEEDIEFENKFHKIIKSKDYEYVFNENIFGKELKDLSDELCNTYNEDFEVEIIKQIKAIKDFKYFIEKRSDVINILKNRLSEAREYRVNILKQN